MKKLITLITAGALILLITPLVAYKDLSSDIKQSINAFNQNLAAQGSPFVVSLQSLDQGNYTSQFALEVEIPGVIENGCIELKGTLHHSPVTLLSLNTLTSEFNGDINGIHCPARYIENAKAFAQIFPHGILKGSTAVGFGGSTKIRVQTYDISFADDEYSVEIAPILFIETSNKDDSKTTSSLHWLGGNIIERNSDINVSLPELKTVGTIEYSGDTLTTAQSTTRIEAFELTSATRGTFGFSNGTITSHYEAGIDQGVADFGFSLSGIELMDEYLGDQVIDLTIHNIDLNYLNNHAVAMQSDQITTEQALAAAQNLITYLAEHITVDINELSLTAGEAKLNLIGDIAFNNKQSVTPEAKADILWNDAFIQHFSAIQAAITLKSKGIKDEAIIGRYAEDTSSALQDTLAQYVAMGNIDENNGEYRTQLKLSNNKLWLNDILVQLPH